MKTIRVKLVPLSRVAKYTDVNGNIRLPYPFGGYKVLQGKGATRTTQYQVTKRV